MGPPFENGGGLHRAAHEASQGQASMGPPFENGGGFRCTQVYSTRTPSASMGPPFENGGGIAELEKEDSIYPLQWGRRSKTAEGQHDLRLAAERLRASMGPPFENGGGSSATGASTLTTTLASMGPPFENGGGTAGILRRAAADMTRFNGAAVRKRRRGW